MVNGIVYYYDDDRSSIYISRPMHEDIIIPSSQCLHTESGKYFTPYIRIPRRSFLARHLPIWIWPFGRVKKLEALQ